MATIKIEVDIDDIIHDLISDGENEDYTFNINTFKSGVIDSIHSSVKQEVMKRLEPTIADIKTNLVKDSVLMELAKEATIIAKDRLSNPSIYKYSRYGRSNEIGTLDEYITDGLLSEDYTDKIHRIIVQQIQASIKVIEDRYDAQFAAGLITKLHQAGYLTDKGETLLVTEKTE